MTNTKNFPTNFHSQTTMEKLEMFDAREKLMIDIDCIIESFCMEMWEGKYPETQDDLTRLLCDAVCKNFPIN